MGEYGRFTSWFSVVEKTALETSAREQETNVNVIIRQAVRAYLGSDALKKAALQVAGETPTEVTPVAGNNGE